MQITGGMCGLREREGNVQREHAGNVQREHAGNVQREHAGLETELGGMRGAIGREEGEQEFMWVLHVPPHPMPYLCMC